MNTSQKKIEKYYPPLYEGHNTEMNYRYLGFFPVAYMAWEIISYKSFLYTRYKIPFLPIYRWKLFSLPADNRKKFFFALFPAYILFDLVYRNVKYNKNKSSNYIMGYTADLVLFHSMATFLFPFALFKLTAKSLPVLWSKIIRRYYPMLILSMGSFFLIGAYQVKALDIFTDYLLDNSFRKYIFDFKKEFSGLKSISLDNLNYDRKIEEAIFNPITKTANNLEYVV